MPINLTEERDPKRYEHLTQLRLEDPQSVFRAAESRERHPGVTYGKQNFIVAADHPARGANKVGNKPLAMADRRDLLDRQPSLEIFIQIVENRADHARLIGSADRVSFSAPSKASSSSGQ